MTPVQKNIISYISHVTGGMVTMQQKHAAEIIKIVQSQRSAYVVLYSFNGNTSQYDKVRRIETNVQKINDEIKKALAGKLWEGFYKYICYNNDEEIEGTIYSLNPDLF